MDALANSTKVQGFLKSLLAYNSRLSISTNLLLYKSPHQINKDPLSGVRSVKWRCRNFKNFKIIYCVRYVRRQRLSGTASFISTLMLGLFPKLLRTFKNFPQRSNFDTQQSVAVHQNLQSI